MPAAWCMAALGANRIGLPRWAWPAIDSHTPTELSVPAVALRCNGDAITLLRVSRCGAELTVLTRPDELPQVASRWRNVCIVMTSLPSVTLQAAR